MKKTQAAKSARKKTVTNEMPLPVNESMSTPAKKGKFPFWLLVLALLVAGGFYLATKYRWLFVAGTVNGKPITRIELEVALNDRYAKNTFDDLASVVLLRQLSAKNGVEVSQDDLNKEISATEERVGGKEALTATLERIGYSQIRFREEIGTQVRMRKLAEKLFKAEITDDEVSKFYQENKTLFPDQKFEVVKENIKNNLTEQKLQEQFTTWFQEQRKNAAVVSFLR